jgi:hypothetical protein
MLAALDFVDAQVERLNMGDATQLDKLPMKYIIDAVMDAPESNIVVTAHTKNLVEMGKRLKHVISNRHAQKTVALTGALQPWVLGPGQDALGNLATAIGAAQHLPAGAWISLKGLTFDPDDLAIKLDPDKQIVWGLGHAVVGSEIYRELQEKLDAAHGEYGYRLRQRQ